MMDQYDLQRFVDAQDPVYDSVCEELQRGWKEGCWMWFIFPQLTGLGSSAMSTRFGISCLAEAEAFLEHPILGPRLNECTEIVNLLQDLTVEQIFGYPDCLKFHSSMTLFAQVQAPRDSAMFVEALRKYYARQYDPSTLSRL